jgi:hypothetical protein
MSPLPISLTLIKYFQNSLPPQIPSLKQEEWKDVTQVWITYIL